ncbi:MAG: BON domain-containing protein [Bryobacteraceae bacterium]
MGILLALAGFTTVWATAWAPRVQAQPAVRARPAPARPATVRLTDAQLEAEIRARLARSKIGADKFQVHVQGGVATFDGNTDVLQHKGAATRLAKSAGAAAVRNRIQLSDAAKQRASANLEKGRRRAQISRGEARSEPRGAARSVTTTPKAAPPVRPRVGASKAQAH